MILLREEQMTNQRIDTNFKTFAANTADESGERLFRAMDKFLEFGR